MKKVLFSILFLATQLIYASEQQSQEVTRVESTDPLTGQRTRTDTYHNSSSNIRETTTVFLTDRTPGTIASHELITYQNGSTEYRIVRNPLQLLQPVALIRQENGYDDDSDNDSNRNSESTVPTSPLSLPIESSYPDDDRR